MSINREWFKIYGISKLYNNCSVVKKTEVDLYVDIYILHENIFKTYW